MKILYLHQYFNTPFMAGGTRSYEMARRLVASGHEVNLITSNRVSSNETDWNVTNENGIQVHWYPIPYSNHMNFMQRIKIFIQFAIASARKAVSIKADVIFATSTPLTIAFPALYTKWRKKIPMVFEVRDMWPAVPIAMGILKNPILVKMAEWLEWLAYRQSKHVIALAPGMRDDIIATGVSPDKISVIPNGCDLDIFGVDFSMQVSKIRHHYEWLQSRPLILFAGTLGRANGVSYMIKLAVNMLDINPEIRFIVIGDGAERDSIETEARQYGVLDKNLFMLPAIPKTDLAAWFAACDFSVGLFSGPRILWKDAVQNKFFDALSAGKPVACNFSGFQSELAIRYNIGIILDPNDPKMAASSLYQKLKDVQWMSSAQSKARQLAKSKFNRNTLAKELELILESVVSSKRINHDSYNI